MRFGEDDPVSWWVPVFLIVLWLCIWRAVMWLAGQV
jgi:hypothetical protein